MSAALIAKALLLLAAIDGVAAQRADGQYWPCNPIVSLSIQEMSFRSFPFITHQEPHAITARSADEVILAK